mmetsp:Transcript_17607/g.22844  ORF Transcript_17607/g.22844 Transcript_17607/m.22844 type:complete len:97 (-) Transcript_17607:721-1011(-)
MMSVSQTAMSLNATERFGYILEIWILNIHTKLSSQLSNKNRNERRQWESTIRLLMLSKHCLNEKPAMMRLLLFAQNNPQLFHSQHLLHRERQLNLS